MSVVREPLQEVLSKLPHPPEGKACWPWTIVDDYRDDLIAAADGLPKISVVTPSLNQAEFLEETIRSVILQGYPRSEYIVIDGGSTDGSIDILERYSAHINYWVSEPDEGQTQALNKGFARANGEWQMWLNSDDVLLPGALHRLAATIRNNPNADWIVGNVVVTDENLQPKRTFEPVCNTDDWTDFLCNKRKTGTSIPQPGSCWSRNAWLEAGKLDETLRYVMDFEYWVRLARKGYRPLLLPEDLALFRLTSTSKSGGGMAKFISEEKVVVAKYLREKQLEEPLRVFLYRFFLQPTWLYRIACNKMKNLFLGISPRAKK